MGNKHLQKSQKVKNDESYTQLEDIELELPHYKNYLKGKVVYCNCDNPEISKFWTFFHTHFAEYGLKALIATYYDRTQFTKKWTYTGDSDADVMSAEITDLKSHGDFRSAACVQILKEADIVVTNPPFSLAQSFVAYLQKHQKPFIIVAPMTLITFKQCCKMICDRQLYVGVNLQKTRRRNIMHFITPDNEIVEQVAWWFSTIRPKYQKPVYTPEIECHASEYKSYENYDALYCDSIKAVPLDTDRVLGVPLSFLRDLNYEQFMKRISAPNSGTTSGGCGTTRPWRCGAATTRSSLLYPMACGWTARD